MTPRKDNPGRRGPKPTYDADRHPVLVKWMARNGLTGDRIAAELGINQATLYRWARQYPELCESLKEGRDSADARVEGSLYQRATGYNFENQEIHKVTTEDERPVTGNARGEQMGLTRKSTKTVQRVKKVKIHVPPDVTAQIFWLKNRQPARWREKPDPNALPAGTVSFDLSVLSDEELSLLHAVRKKLAAAPARPALGGN